MMTQLSRFFFMLFKHQTTLLNRIGHNKTYHDDDSTNYCRSPCYNSYQPDGETIVNLHRPLENGQNKTKKEALVIP